MARTVAVLGRHRFQALGGAIAAIAVAVAVGQGIGAQDRPAGPGGRGRPGTTQPAPSTSSTTLPLTTTSPSTTSAPPTTGAPSTTASPTTVAVGTAKTVPNAPPQLVGGTRGQPTNTIPKAGANQAPTGVLGNEALQLGPHDGTAPTAFAQNQKGAVVNTATNRDTAFHVTSDSFVETAGYHVYGVSLDGGAALSGPNRGAAFVIEKIGPGGTVVSDTVVIAGYPGGITQLTVVAPGKVMGNTAAGPVVLDLNSGTVTRATAGAPGATAPR